MRISNKQQMYKLLLAGELGNTTPQWLSIDEWFSREVASPLWGIRSMVPGHSELMLDVPTNEVAKAVEKFTKGYNISPMVDNLCVMRGNVWDSQDSGLCLHYTPVSGMVKWRNAFEALSYHVDKSASLAILKSYFNANSYDDLQILLVNYPGHVIEFTVLSKCAGTVPGRNVIIWEVRNY